MKSITKEIFIILLLCIAICLIFGVIFYDYIPTNKVVPSTVEAYKTSNTIKDERPQTAVYNAILGGGANSKLFQNVREKASLAYSAGSLYIKNKNSIVIRSGIENKNYEKALDIIEKQIEDMKQGNFDEKDIQNAKQLIVASFRSMEDEQDSTISYYFGKEMEQENADIATYISKIENVTKEQIVKVAQNVTINTIYFLSK